MEPTRFTGALGSPELRSRWTLRSKGTVRASEKFLHAFPHFVPTGSTGDLLSDDGRNVDDGWSDRFGHFRESVGRKRPDRPSHGWCGGRRTGRRKRNKRLTPDEEHRAQQGHTDQPPERFTNQLTHRSSLEIESDRD